MRLTGLLDGGEERAQTITIFYSVRADEAKETNVMLTVFVILYVKLRVCRYL